MTSYLSLEDLPTLAGDLGVGPVRDIGLLDAAAQRPQVELDAPDDDAYELVMSIARSEPTVEDIAAVLGAWH